jgi:hypothetical protein
LVARELEPGALAPPDDYELIWDDVGTGAVLNGSMWRPVPPAGYVCLGSVAQAQYTKPPLDAIRCVAEDLLVPGRIESSPWDDTGSGIPSDFHAWKIGPAETITPDFGIDLGTFVGVGARALPSEFVYTLHRRSVAQPDVDPVALQLLIRQYAPRLLLHPAEKFLPDDVVHVLDTITDLCGALVAHESN